MFKMIPSWVVAVFGAVIVIIATLVSYVSIRGLDKDILKVEGEILEINSEISRLWDSHKLSDSRKYSVDFFTTLLNSSNNQDIVISNIGNYMMGSILAMYTATDEDIPDREPEEIDKLKAGDLSVYSKLNELLESLRRKSAVAINERKRRLDEFEIEKARLERDKNIVSFWYMFLNIMGLIVVLFKDLPIWKSS